jgi:hypothetical protein
MPAAGRLGRSQATGVGRAARRAVAAGPVETVTDALKLYADRGVFKGFNVRDSESRRPEFTFTWLTRRPMSLLYDSRTSRLIIADLFPHVDPRSDMVADLRRLIVERSSSELPAHKRLDRRKAQLTCTVRRGRLAVQLLVRGSSHAYAVRYLLNLVNELHLRLHEAYPEYLIAHFGVSPE